MFVACGLNHKTAPLDVRERLAMHMNTHNGCLNDLLDEHHVSEAIILSTCNRTEIYCETQEPDALIPWLAKTHHIPLATLAPFMYQYHGHAAIQHTLRVASGLDSMMLGEPQILGQMKTAYQTAYDSGHVKRQLGPLFQYIFRASKRVRHGSGINKNPISVAFAAVQLIGQHFNAAQSLRILLIGSGETAALVGKYLQQQERHHFMIASRTGEHAESLANQLQGQAVPITDLACVLPQADVVITATACPLPFISTRLVAQAMIERQQAPMFLLDLAVPRDIESAVKDLPDIHLYNIDDLQDKIEHGMQERRSAATHAESLIQQELERYEHLDRTRQAQDVICTYRHQMHLLAQQELQRAMQRLDAGQSQHQVLTEFSERLINKITHTPTVGLKQAAIDNREDLLLLVNYLFTES